ncbi:MAG TPA: hypothetical protein VE224_21055, partial [Pseudolabrys sp.]|nr:hypothetical protein [Pseudolabrys sp.]
MARRNPLNRRAAPDGVARTGFAAPVGFSALALGALGAGIWVGWALAAPSAVPVPKPRPTMAALPKTPPPHPQSVPLPRKRPEAAIKARAYAEAEMGLRGPVFSSQPSVQVKVQPGTGAFAVAPTNETSAADMAALKQVLE